MRLASVLVMLLTGCSMSSSSERVLRERDRSLVFETPATLVVSRGSGEATITVLDDEQRLAVQPLGVSADSAERGAVVGRTV